MRRVMDFKELNSFTAALSGIDKCNGYIVQRSGLFFVADSKQDKLNTSAIEKRARQAIALISRTSMNYETKALYYSDMAQGLKDYIGRVYTHKSILEKIGWWFGMCSETEKALYKEYKQCWRNAAKFGGIDRDIKVAYRPEEVHLARDIRLKLAYMSVMDASRLRIPTLCGIRPHQASSWMLEELKAWRATFVENHPDIKNVDAAIEKMSQAVSVALIEDRALSTSQSPLLARENERVREWLEQELLWNITMLPAGKSFTFNGGYAQIDRVATYAGHSVQYRFVANSDNTWTLTFLNSGEGAEISAIAKEEKKGSLWQAITGSFFEDGLKEKNDRGQVRIVDDVWEHIPYDAINREFIQLLLKYRINKDPTSMATIRREVSAYLAKYHVGYSTSKSDHKAQRQGTCTVKSLTLWMRKELGNRLWHDFKYFYTERQVEKLDDLLHSMKPHERAVFEGDVMKAQSKRRTKAQAVIMLQPKTNRRTFWNRFLAA